MVLPYVWRSCTSFWGGNEMDILIRGGRVIDPGHCDGVGDLYIRDGKIAGLTLGEGGDPQPDGCRVIDARGLVVTPGLIDLHVHLREPGHEYKGDHRLPAAVPPRQGGSRPFAACPTPHPVNDWRPDYGVHSLPGGKGGCGARLSGRCRQSGAARGGPYRVCRIEAVRAPWPSATTGRPIANSLLMRRALEYARGFDIPVISHCEDPDLAEGGAMNEGRMATQLGLPGIPNAAESVMVMRDIALSALTAGMCTSPMSGTAEAVEAIRKAKSQRRPCDGGNRTALFHADG